MTKNDSSTNTKMSAADILNIVKHLQPLKPNAASYTDWAAESLGDIKMFGLDQFITDEDFAKANKESDKHTVVFRMIRRALDENIRKQVDYATDTFMLWKGLRELFNPTTLSAQVTNLRELASLKYNNSGIGEFVADAEILFKKIESTADFVFPTNFKNAFLLSTLPPSFDVLVSVLSTRQDPSLSDIRAALLDHEKRGRALNSASPSAIALSAHEEHKKVGKTTTMCKRCGKEHSMYERCRKVTEKATNNSSDTTRDSARSQDWRGRSNSGKPSQSSAHAARLEDDQPFDVPANQSNKKEKLESFAFTALLALEDENPPSDRIVIDSGASHHFINNSKLFTTLQEIAPRPIGIASDSKYVHATAIGTASVTVSIDGKPTSITLENALLVPSMPLCLLSVAVLNKKGYCVTFGNAACVVSRGETKCFSVPLLQSSGLYEMDIVTATPTSA